MRPNILTVLAVASSLAACMGNVGGGRAGKGSGTDTGSDDPDDDGTCEHIEDYKHDISMHDTESLASTLPSGCYNVIGKLTINGSSVTSLAKLGKIRSVTDLEIIGSGLTSIDTAVPLAVYDGGITFQNNASLTDIGNLELHHVSHVLIDGNAKLTSLDALPLETIDGDSGDSRRDGTLTITNNGALVDLSLPTVTRIDGPIKIANNAVLKSVSLGALMSVGTYPWKGTIAITSNPQLTTISALMIQAMTGDFVVSGSPSLSTLGGLTQLSHVGGAFTIDGTALSSLGALGAPFAFVDGTVTINNNPNLATLDRLSHMMDGGNNNWRTGGIGGSLVITNNHNLPYCEAHAVDYCTNIAGSININNNKQNTGNCQSWCRNM